MGCLWVEVICTGVAWECDNKLLFTEQLCNSQPGCTWGGMCSGIPDDCPSFDYDSCLNQDGCEQVEECAGDVTACSGYDDETECDDQEGCYWTN